MSILYVDGGNTRITHIDLSDPLISVVGLIQWCRWIGS